MLYLHQDSLPTMYGQAQLTCMCCRDSADVRWHSIAGACKRLHAGQPLPSVQLLQAGNPRMLLAALATLFTTSPGELCWGMVSSTSTAISR